MCESTVESELTFFLSTAETRLPVRENSEPTRRAEGKERFAIIMEFRPTVFVRNCRAFANDWDTLNFVDKIFYLFYFSSYAFL